MRTTTERTYPPRPTTPGWLLTLVALACGPAAPNAVSDTGDETTGTSESLPTSGAPASEPTGSTIATTSTTGTTGELDCEAVCADPKIHQGDLEITPDTDAASLHCIREVIGDVWIQGFDGPLPGTLQSLRTVDDIVISGNHGLVDLHGLECLQHVDRLLIDSNDVLVDIDALAGLESVDSLIFQFMDTLADMSPLSGATGVRVVFIQLCQGLKVLPTFPPGTQLEVLEISGAGFIDLDPLIHTQVESVSLDDLPALADISGLTDRWRDGSGSVWLGRLPQLTSLAGLEGLQHGGSIGIDDLPQLASLAPLQELITLDKLRLSELPQLAILAPLAGLTEIGELSLDGLPALTSLADLSGLQRVGTLELGDCLDGSLGVDALVDLSGLGNLGELNTLRLLDNALLHSLDGLDALTVGPERLDAVGNPNLPPEVLAAFVAAHAVANTCIDPPTMCCPHF